MAPTADELQDKTVEELRELAADAEIEGRSKLDKDGLVAALADDVDSPEDGEDAQAPYRREGSGADEPGAFATATGAAGEPAEPDEDDEDTPDERIVAAREAARLRERQDEEGVPARFRRAAVVDPALRRDAQRTVDLEERSSGTARSGIRP